MAQFVNKLRDCIRTVNLTMLLMLNLFCIVTLNLTVATVLVVLKADHGFFYPRRQHQHRRCAGYFVCQLYFDGRQPCGCDSPCVNKAYQNIIQAMNRLAAGDFTVRLQPAAHGV